MTDDLAGHEYWDRNWDANGLQPPLDWSAPNLGNYVVRRHDQLFARVIPQDARSIIEVGSGGSVWLPYFSQRFGLEVTGIDYSEVGTRQSLEVADRAEVDARLVHGDMFQPPKELVSAHDIAVSIGLIEHFTDTAAAVRAIANMVRPGGLIITEIPNMTWLTGLAQRAVNPSVYARHVPLHEHAVRVAHEEAGLNVLECSYFIFNSFDVINPGDGLEHPSSVWQRRLAWVLQRLSRMSWLLDSGERLLRPNRVTSPYVVCIPRRPEP